MNILKRISQSFFLEISLVKICYNDSGMVHIPQSMHYNA